MKKNESERGLIRKTSNQRADRSSVDHSSNSSSPIVNKRAIVKFKLQMDWVSASMTNYEVCRADSYLRDLIHHLLFDSESSGLASPENALTSLDLQNSLSLSLPKLPSILSLFLHISILSFCLSNLVSSHFQQVNWKGKKLAGQQHSRKWSTGTVEHNNKRRSKINGQLLDYFGPSTLEILISLFSWYQLYLTS